jgi:MFS family permease
MKQTSRYRWFVVGAFFAFMLLHQADKLLIGPLTSQIMETYGIDEVQMGAVFTGALIVSAILYPLWGYLYDRFFRSKLLALASLIWGLTTWLSAIAPTYPIFLVTRASTGIDDSSYPGIYSLISDYFSPKLRGKVYGFLQLSGPLGYLIGMVAAIFLGASLGWRGVFYITGSLGLLLAVVIFFGVKDMPRGKSEPELEHFEDISTYKIEKEVAFGLLRKRSLLLLFAQGFLGVFPWNVITYWFFRYLETERNYSSDEVLLTMVPVVLVLASGYFIAGWLGDWLFRHNRRGRMIIATIGVLAGAIFLSIAMNVPQDNKSLFIILLGATALFMPFASPNVISTIFDITLPEVRSTALAIQYLIENGGAALAPLLAGIIASRYNLHTAILFICVSAWLLSTIFLVLVIILVPKDIAVLRNQMKERAALEAELQGSQTTA